MPHAGARLNSYVFCIEIYADFRLRGTQTLEYITMAKRNMLVGQFRNRKHML